MHDMEDELKPTLVNMISGIGLTLDLWRRRRLATWAAKTAMTAEFIDAKTAAIPFEYREHLRLAREPPRGFHVWAAHYIGGKYSTSIHHHAGHMSFADAPIHTKSPHVPNTQATLIGVGRLILQIANSSVGGLVFNLHDEEISRLRRIWVVSPDVV
ncbi:MAG: hypothetical protein ACT4N4_14325 [Rhodospirillales bacterium]